VPRRRKGDWGPDPSRNYATVVEGRGEVALLRIYRIGKSWAMSRGRPHALRESKRREGSSRGSISNWEKPIDISSLRGSLRHPASGNAVTQPFVTAWDRERRRRNREWRLLIS